MRFKGSFKENIYSGFNRVKFTKIDFNSNKIKDLNK